MLSSRRPRLALLAASAACLGFTECSYFYGFGSEVFHFREPLFEQLTEPRQAPVALEIPPIFADLPTLQVTLTDPHGEKSAVDMDPQGGVAFGLVDATESGEYRLEAKMQIDVLSLARFELYARTRFTTVVLDNADECEVLNQVECLLPYPSSRFMVPDATTATGFRLAIPEAGMPDLNGDPLTTEFLNELDGFGPMVQILMHFPGGVDLEASDAPRLLGPECCGQPPGPPWIGTRTYSDRSLDDDSPTVIIDADTGERILHFAELDARAAGNPERQALVLRPGQSLTPGHRYVVAVRDLVDPNGDPVEPEPVFAAIREWRPTTIKAVRDKRTYVGNHIAPVLWEQGIALRSLLLAFDFVVQSDHQLTHQMLSMRDQAFEWLDEQAAAGARTFTVDEVIEDFDCSEENATLARIVKGTFQSPLFLEGDLDPILVHFMNVDENDVPVMNGTTDAVFDIGIPCSALDGSLARPLLLGHGLFGRGADMVEGIPGLTGALGFDFGYIAGATDWRGLSSPDLAWVGTQIVGINVHALNNFPAFPDRLRQGMLNTLVLARMMKAGVFNVDPAFHDDKGVGVFPGPEEEMFYYGISLGGVHGTWLSALTPDIQRFGLDVPAINFSILLQRSTQFRDFETLIHSIGLTDPMETILGFGLNHELWTAAGPSGYATHITRDRLPGSGEAAKVLLTPAWLDKQVSNQATEITARTLGVPSLLGSLQQGLVGIPDEEGPLESAMVMWDTGPFDILDPAFYVDDDDGRPIIPPLANVIPSPRCDPHGDRPGIPASVQQLLDFLQPGGLIENTCESDNPGDTVGLCDAGSEWERSFFETEEEVCDPL